jgi:hypothetical protein
MKLLLILPLLALALPALSQVRELADCSEPTRRFISQYYTIDKQIELNEDPEKLTKLEYICVHSYEFAPGQTILNSQRNLFIVQRYEHMRRQNYRVTITDEYSGLKVILFSWDEVEQQKVRISGQFQLAESE